MLQEEYLIELFSFCGAPVPLIRPKAQGLGYLGFRCADIDRTISSLEADCVDCESVRIYALTGKNFTFFTDRDGLSMELYEA